MKRHKNLLIKGNHHYKKKFKKVLTKSIDKKIKEKIHKEIIELIKSNMEDIESNLLNSSNNIDIEKENLINYKGENISLLSNSLSEIYLSIENNSSPQEKQKTLTKDFTNENNSNDNRIKNQYNQIEENNYSKKLTIFDPDSTSNTYKKEVNNISINKINSNIAFIPKSELNNIYESELINFFLEINLPSSYAFKFIENGFDDLDILIEMTKTGIAISNQNLKEFGIINSSDRAKILINLEEKAGVTPINV